MQNGNSVEQQEECFMPNCLDITTYDCLDGDHLNRGLFLQSIIKANLSLGALDKAALALVELRKIFRDQAKIFETLSPYFPIGNTLSEDVAQYRLSRVVELADQLDG